MKQQRRRRHLRPRPCRSQVNQQLEHIRSTIQTFQIECLLEASKPEPSLPRLRFLDHMLGLLREEAVSLETF